ncbi:N-acetyltaurine hydrolase-like [Babylonia areolata]|uniref:N-acetyltaurine hydrolase-like n=1 Tax=Babylonia areolata TaxID=304850 RepID=UPI003FD1B1D2
MADRKYKIQTVCGLIEAGELGPTLTHEHLMLEADPIFISPSEASSQHKTHMPFTMENLGWIRQNPYSYKPNLSFMSEKDTIIQEVMDYKSLGGGGIVENSTIGLNRDLTFLRKLSSL